MPENNLSSKKNQESPAEFGPLRKENPLERSGDLNGEYEKYQGKVLMDIDFQHLFNPERKTE